ncbi:hypothetical protein CHS0354_003563 [Potamilus streckersoni]|uniref:BACK domain-containing protein n=1 Tax=Potamilus streckersoni TaxID=2493646 RepID=A0AAE0RVA7_9BIVA|nr:hypothetical protein CHS0354_003563 [Potamilus streckersoni]
MYAGKKYAVASLVDKCVLWLKEGVGIDNVCSILQQAHVFDEHDLQRKCLEFIMDNGSSVLKHSSFRNLSSDCVEMVIRQDELWTEEEVVYEAMKDWAGNECARKNIQPSAENIRQTLGGLVNLIRFSVMDGKYFADRVAVDNLLTADQKVSFLRHFLSSGSLNNMEYIQTKRTSRFQEKQRVIRFPGSGGILSVGSTKLAIDFRCSKDVLLCGIVIYGGMQYFGMRMRQDYVPFAFVSDTEIQLLDESKRTIVSMKRQMTITEEELLEVLFDDPVVLKMKWYTITLVISTPGLTRSGENGERVVNLGDGQSVEFRDSSLSSSDTNVLIGQIPDLLLCRRR